MDMTFTHSESGPGCISPHGVYITSNSCLSSLPATPHVRLVQDNPPALTHLDSNFTRLPTFRHPNCGWDARPARAMPLDGSSACAAPRPRSSISGQENISPDSHNAQRSARLSITQGVGIGSNARFCSKALRHDHPQSSVSGPVVDIFFDVASWDPGEIFNSGEKEGSCLHGRHPWDDHGERTASCRGCWRSPGSPDLHRDTSTAPHARGNRRGSYSSRRRRFAPLPRSARSNLPQFSLKKSSRIHLLSCPGCARRSQRLIPRSSPLNHFLGPGNRAGNLYDKLTVNRQVPTHGAEHKTRNSDNGVLAAETPQAHVHLLIIPRAITRDASLASARSLWDPDRAKVALRAVVTGAKLLPVSFIPSRQRSRTRAGAGARFLPLDSTPRLLPPFTAVASPTMSVDVLPASRSQLDVQAPDSDHHQPLPLSLLPPDHTKKHFSRHNPVDEFGTSLGGFSLLPPQPHSLVQRTPIFSVHGVLSTFMVAPVRDNIVHTISAPTSAQYFSGTIENRPSDPLPFNALALDLSSQSAAQYIHQYSTAASGSGDGGGGGGGNDREGSVPSSNASGQNTGTGGGRRGRGKGKGKGKGRARAPPGGDGGQKPAPKKTENACTFCRGRKLKCDGLRPTCHNCTTRRQVCEYTAVIKRRGPGKEKGKAKREPGAAPGPSRKRKAPRQATPTEREQQELERYQQQQQEYQREYEQQQREEQRLQLEYQQQQQQQQHPNENNPSPGNTRYAGEHGHPTASLHSHHSQQFPSYPHPGQMLPPMYTHQPVLTPYTTYGGGQYVPSWQGGSVAGGSQQPQPHTGKRRASGSPEGQPHPKRLSVEADEDEEDEWYDDDDEGTAR